MIRGLVEKELRQHRTLLAFILLLLAVGQLALFSNKHLGNAGGGAVFPYFPSYGLTSFRPQHWCLGLAW